MRVSRCWKCRLALTLFSKLFLWHKLNGVHGQMAQLQAAAPAEAIAIESALTAPQPASQAVTSDPSQHNATSSAEQTSIASGEQQSWEGSCRGNEMEMMAVGLMLQSPGTGPAPSGTRVEMAQERCAASQDGSQSLVWESGAGDEQSNASQVSDSSHALPCISKSMK